MSNEYEKQTLSEGEAAVYLGLSSSFLRKARMNGQLSDGKPGPKYAKIGKRTVCYTKKHLDEFLESRVVQTVCV